MLSATAQHLNSQEPLKLNAEGLNEAAMNNTMVGRYPFNFKNPTSIKEVVVVGGGEVYQKMIGPALKHLGIKVYLYDPNNEVPNNFGEERLRQMWQAPEKVPVLILSPNRFHSDQTYFFTRRGSPVIVEKPACLPEEIDKLRGIINESKVPTYWIDFNHMMARVLIALAGGVKMPFMDAIEVSSDETDRLSEALKNGAKLTDSKIKIITGRYIQKAGAAGGTFENRDWLRSVKEGGGVLRDMMTRLFNISQLIGMNTIDPKTCELLSYMGKDNKITLKDVPNLAEDYAKVTGTMANGVIFDFEVGKYAEKNDLHFTIEYESGEKLKLDWLPPNRKNRVTWFDKDGKEIGQVLTVIDPYLLIVIDALKHIEQGKLHHLYLEEQLESVRLTANAAALGRNKELQLAI